VLVRLGCLFVLVPLLELALLIQVGRWMGVLPTVAVVGLTGLVGAWLMRTEGLRTLARFQEELAKGELPGQALMDGAAVLTGGAFLLTPGVLTDALGFALLFRPSRRLLQAWAVARMVRGVQSGSLRVTFLRADGSDGDARDADRTDIDEEDGPPPRAGEIVQ
jgi:UPF0716 protein FxsA